MKIFNLFFIVLLGCAVHYQGLKCADSSATTKKLLSLQLPTAQHFAQSVCNKTVAFDESCVDSLPFYEKALVQFLMKHNNNLDAALLDAAVDYPFLVESLLLAGADLHVSDKRGYTPVLLAAENNDEKTVALFRRYGAENNDLTADGFNAVTLAARAGNLALVRALLQDGFALQSNALTYAVQSGNAALVEYLLAQGADVTAVDNGGKTPLHNAVARNALPIITLLFKYNADALLTPEQRTALLLQAIGSSSLPIVQLLMQRWQMQDPVENNSGQTAMHAAARNPDDAVLDYFINQGLALDAVDTAGNTPLHYAAKSGNAKNVRMLLDNDVDADVQNNDAQTPIMSAVLANKVKVTQLLVDEGAYLFAPDLENENALCKARRRGHAEIADILIEHMPHRY